jgi:hypothetical protein
MNLQQDASRDGWATYYVTVNVYLCITALVVTTGGSETTGIDRLGRVGGGGIEILGIGGMENPLDPAGVHPIQIRLRRSSSIRARRIRR